MAILKCPSGEVEIRLRGTRPKNFKIAYFDEYEEVKVKEYSGKSRCTRYIIPEDTRYAIEVILKSGFHLGDCEGVRIKIYDKATDNFIGQKKITRGPGEYLAIDKTILIETVYESLDKETNVVGVSVERLGGLQVRVAKCSKKETTTVSRKEFERQLARYEGRQVIGQAQKIDETSYNKDGITHAIGLSGGIVGKKIETPTQMQFLRQETDKLCFDFICRSAEFLENNSFMKSPLPLELQPWDHLTSDQRDTALRTLEAHKKEHIFEQNIAKFGELQTKEEAPNPTTRPRNKRQAKIAFLALQHLRVDFENQKKQSATFPVVVPASICPQPAKVQSLSPETKVLPSTLEHIAVDANQIVRTSTPNPERNVIIVLDDSPPRTHQRDPRTRSPSTQAGTQAEPVDLDTFVSKSGSSSSGIVVRFKPEVNYQSESKRLKLSPPANDYAGHFSKFRKTRLAAIATLYREAEELKASIEEMEETKE
ncbi:uncharacterized protein RCO7_08480 [Rhynchosporium graminicola]|uniref:Uncharacterized protein n=1 Tax=Rhynchosporium graminicola TaxID=2792576 RepID=A0A1E1L4R3_9HELO|nr:uncharacterized protein RCO7_08480 [Rhynchosporium commune]